MSSMQSGSSMNLQEQYAEAQVSQGEQFVQLYKSLGGGWQNYQAVPEHPPATAGDRRGVSQCAHGQCALTVGAMRGSVRRQHQVAGQRQTRDGNSQVGDQGETREARRRDLALLETAYEFPERQGREECQRG